MPLSVLGGAYVKNKSVTNKMLIRLEIFFLYTIITDIISVIWFKTLFELRICLFVYVLNLNPLNVLGVDKHLN